MLVRFHDEADAEAQAVHDIYAADSPEKGARFETELRHVVETIQRFPKSGHPLIRGTRRKLMHGFEYSVVYKIFPDYIQILAIAHFKQEWGYWLNRLEEA
jgi:plasmid stabilization system protein ParE